LLGGITYGKPAEQAEEPFDHSGDALISTGGTKHIERGKHSELTNIRLIADDQVFLP
jgi:hypothetical protein